MRMLRVLLLSATMACVGAANAAEPMNASDNPEIAVDGAGTLKIENATEGNGAIASFTPIEPQTRYCSGACDGMSVGSWTCPDNQNCLLNCTTRPPTKGCY